MSEKHGLQDTGEPHPDELARMTDDGAPETDNERDPVHDRFSYGNVRI